MSNHAIGKVLHFCRALRPRDAAEPTDGQLLGKFIEQGDQTAFETLVRRHGPMVLGVCRRILRNHHSAEDAFQATFLVLARKSLSIRNRDLLASWLYGVAFHTALRARTAAGRRSKREKQVVEMPEPEILANDLWSDLAPVLDQELSRLPEKYRMPIILCDLEGKGHAEAARQLRCPLGTLSGRLWRGRNLLARRLTRRGLGISAVVLGMILVEKAQAAASVGLASFAAAVKGAACIAAGASLAEAVSSKVIALARGAMESLVLKKLKLTVAALLILSALALGTGLSRRTLRSAGQPDSIASLENGRDGPRDPFDHRASLGPVAPGSLPSLPGFVVLKNDKSDSADTPNLEVNDAIGFVKVGAPTVSTFLVQPISNTLTELDADGTVRWSLGGLSSPRDVEPLPGGRLLVAEQHQVAERSADGEVLWKHEIQEPVSAQRLKNGHTFIVCWDRLVEVDQDGKQVLNVPMHVAAARRLLDGKIVAFDGRSVIQFNDKGQKPRTVHVNCGGAGFNEVLENGHVLALSPGNGNIIEFDVDGKQVGRFDYPGANHGCRLPNGHTLVTHQEGGEYIELDENWKVVKINRLDPPAAKVKRSFRSDEARAQLDKSQSAGQPDDEFFAMDKNGDGVLTVDESPRGMKNHGAASAAILLVQPAANSVAQLGPEGKTRWTLTRLNIPRDIEVLPGGQVLVTEQNQITEGSLGGKILWKYPVHEPLSAQRLKNGHTFIVCLDRLLEVDRAGKQVLNVPMQVAAARRLPDGKIVAFDRQNIFHLDARGQALKSVPVNCGGGGYNEVLDNGHVLALSPGIGNIIEFDADGREIGRYDYQGANYGARLPNGHTLVTHENGREYIEVDENWKLVKTTKLETRTLKVKSVSC